MSFLDDITTFATGIGKDITAISATAKSVSSAVKSFSLPAISLGTTAPAGAQLTSSTVPGKPSAAVATPSAFLPGSSSLSMAWIAGGLALLGLILYLALRK